MTTEPKTNYLAKLLTLLVKRSEGMIRIPIQDLMVDDIGQGFQVHFSQDTKELVLSYVPAGSTIYKIEGATTWLTNELLPSNRPKPSAPLTQEELIARSWSESAATPTLSESSMGRSSREGKNKVVTLTTEAMADAEVERRKQEVLREIENYQSPQPPSHQRTPSRPLQTFSKQ